MENNLDCDVFLFLSKEKMIISVNSESNKNIYREELTHNQNLEALISDKLDTFLNDNIFKIEKKIENFIKNIYIILESENFFPVEISIKKIDHDNSIITKNLNYLLIEAQDCCKRTIEEKQIIHMIIDNYKINDKVYLNLPKDIDGSTFSISVKFHCVSLSIVKNLEKILKRYEISLGKIISEDYLNKFLNEYENDKFIMAKKLINGYDKNEVLIVEKTQKNRGFFEKFFNFFS